MSRRGREANLTEKLAACLLMIRHSDGSPLLPITREQAKSMTAKEICALVEFHHEALKRIDPSNHPTMLTPMLIADHRERTAKIDQPVLAKVRRFEQQREAAPVEVKTGYQDVFGNDLTRPEKRKTRWQQGRKIARHSDPWGKNKRQG